MLSRLVLAFGVAIAACTSFDEPATRTPTDAYAATVADDRPIAHFRLTETAGTILTSTNGAHTLIATNAPKLAAAGLFGGTGGAVAFDGSKGPRLVGSTLPPLMNGGGAYAFEAWVYCGNPPDDSYRYLLRQSDGERDIAVFLRTDTMTLDVTTAGKRTFVNHDALTTRTWHHVVVQGASEAEPRLWIDGVESKPTGDRGETVEPTRALTIGADADQGTSIGPDAKVAEIAIYDHVLAANRVTAHYALGQKQ